jgi:hypothetical protein
MFVQVPFSVDVPTSSSLLGQSDVCGQPLANECQCALGQLMVQCSQPWSTLRAWPSYGSASHSVSCDIRVSVEHELEAITHRTAPF